MTTNTFSGTPQPVRVTLDSDPAQLLAAIPHLMGFHPAESVVLVGHRPTEPPVLGWLLRGDLPPEDFEAEQAAEMAARLALSDAFGVTIVIIGGTADAVMVRQLPHGSLVEALSTACAGARLRVLHALWTPEIRADAAWRCYQDADCHGSLPDPGSSTLAATMATTGRVTFDSRSDLADLLTPDPAESLARRSALLNTAVDRFDSDDDRDQWPYPENNGCACADCPCEAATDVFERHSVAVGRALLRQRAGSFEHSDAEVVRLALALSDVRVRDACLALALPPGSSAALTAESLWIALTRATPGPERAEPAALLGYSAYLRGDGALADIALQAALRASPEHVLAGLLQRALWKGVTPEQLQGLGHVDGVVDLWQEGQRCWDVP